MQTAVDLVATLCKGQGGSHKHANSPYARLVHGELYIRLTNVAGRMDAGMEVHHMQAGAGSFPYAEAGAVGGPAGLLPLCG